MKSRLAASPLLLAFYSVACAAGSPLTHAPGEIGNAWLLVRYDAAAHTFSIADRASGKVFAKDGRLDSADSPAREEESTDPVFGAGRRLVVSRAGGAGEIALEVYSDLPFMLLREVIKNPSPNQADIRSVVASSFVLDLGKPAGELKTLGTGGLLPPEQNPGSYLFLTCADPVTRSGVVAGWLTEDRGSGVIFSAVKNGRVEFKTQIDYGHLRIPAGQSAKLETLAIGRFDDARTGEESYAEAVKRQYHIKLRAPEAVYCSWYAEKHGYAGDEKSTVELAKFAAKELKPFGFGVVQIDDEWQDSKQFNGPRRGFDRVRPDGPYAHGIAPVAAEVDKVGLTFGLWWLPFARNFQDLEYKDRQDWFVKRENGKPYDTPWGGTCLDLTHPEVKAQLARIAKLYRAWGVKYYKMDGLWTGAACEQIYVNDGYRDDNFGNNRPFRDPLVSNVEAYRGGLKLLRESAGDDVFFSGCCISQNMREMTAIGLVDSMRVGPDASGDIRVGPVRGTRLYFLNGRVWWNDPDPAVVRAAGSFMGVNPVTLEEARLTTSWVALSGQFFLLSDWLPGLPPERLEVLKRTMAHHSGMARPVDYFENALPNTWLVTDESSGVHRAVVGVFNFDGKPLTVNHTCGKLGLDAAQTYHAFDFWSNRPIADFRGEFKATAAARACRVIAVRAAEDHPVLISTSRHVSSGILEVKQEKWSDKTLSGISELIGNDPYELRVLGLTDGGKQWNLLSASVSPDDQAAGVTVVQKQDFGTLRVTIQSRVDRTVKWTLRFEAR